MRQLEQRVLQRSLEKVVFLATQPLAPMPPSGLRHRPAGLCSPGVFISLSPASTDAAFASAGNRNKDTGSLIKGCLEPRVGGVPGRTALPAQ